MRLVRFLAAVGIFLTTIVVAAPQRGGAPAAPAAPVQVDGAAVFTRACASCHQAGQTGVPTMDALRAFTPEAVVNALTNGKMSAQGATLSVAERASIAQFLTAGLIDNGEFIGHGTGLESKT